MAAPPVANNSNTDQHHHHHHHQQQQQPTPTNSVVVVPSHPVAANQQHGLQQHGSARNSIRPIVATPSATTTTNFHVPTLLLPSTIKQMADGGGGGTTAPPQAQAVKQQVQQKQPEFVVFELFGKHRQIQQQQQQNGLSTQHQQQQKLRTNKWTTAPFSPLNSCIEAMTTSGSTLFSNNNNNNNEQQQKLASHPNGAESSAAAVASSQPPPILSASNGVCFATVHLWPDHHPSIMSSNISSSSSSNSNNIRTGRLMFDNPMFRRLPNWHFFGDDRRLVPIPPLVPLLPAMPIERTLLYIAPNESSSRQLILLAMLDMKRKSELMGASIGGIGGGPNGDAEISSTTTGTVTVGGSSATTELLDDPLSVLPTEQECPSSSSTSGVESSMSSAEESSSSSSAMTERSSRSTTPTNNGGRSTPEEQHQQPQQRRRMGGQRDDGHDHHHRDGDEQSGNEDEAEEQEGIILFRTDPQHSSNNTRCRHLSSNEEQEEWAIASSSAAESSCTSSTPNSPPTFDRRIVRMSRSTRDAVRRLSRRFEEEWEEEEEEETATMAEDGCAALAADISAENGFVAKLIKMSADEQQDRVLKTPSARRSLEKTKPIQRHNDDEDDVQTEISLMDPLSERIRDFHYNEDQTHAQLNRKLQLRDQLYYAISPIFPMCGLYIVGSSLNGFGTNRSDLDLCLMITNRDIDQRSDAVVVLSSVMRTLESHQIVSEQNLILAKVPILRIKFVGTFHDITVDLNVNNSVAIRNTHLMCYYSSFDWRVRPLVMVVKEWAKRHGINDSACSSFTSYSLVLMVIHYLQCGAQPPVLPNLQQMYPKRFSVRADVRTLNVSLPFEPIPTAMGWQFKDDATLSELLLGFLRYYAFQFDFDTDAISIRMGKKVNRAQVAQNQSPFNTLSQWHCICIEEPFTLSNAAHSVYDERIFQDIKKAFVDSSHELDKHRDLDRFLGPPVAPSTSSTTPTNN